MKKVLLGAVALSALVSVPAFAADMPARVVKAPPPPPVYSWTGFYIGAHVGYGWGDVDTSYTPLPSAGAFADLLPTTLSSDLTGPFGGLQIGYNWQGGPNWLFGLEADISWSGIDGDATSSPIITNGGAAFGAGSALTTNQDVEWFGTVRARLGWLATPTFLLYGTGGFAYGNVKYDANANFLPVGTVQYPGSVDETRFGWTAGAGAEWAFGNNWSAKLEYLYIDLGDESVVANPIPANPPFQVGYDWEAKFHTIRVGLNYKF